MGNDMSAIGGMFGSTASSFGNNMWLIIAMVVTAVIMALGIAGGIEKAIRKVNRVLKKTSDGDLTGQISMKLRILFLSSIKFLKNSSYNFCNTILISIWHK